MRHELDELLRLLSCKFYVVSPLVSLSSMWSFLWLVDSSDASCCHSKPPHSGTDLLPPPSLKHCGTPRVHVSPHGGLEWHWDHNIHSALLTLLQCNKQESCEGPEWLEQTSAEGVSVLDWYNLVKSSKFTYCLSIIFKTGSEVYSTFVLKFGELRREMDGGKKAKHPDLQKNRQDFFP